MLRNGIEAAADGDEASAQEPGRCRGIRSPRRAPPRDPHVSTRPGPFPGCARRETGRRDTHGTPPTTRQARRATVPVRPAEQRSPTVTAPTTTSPPQTRRERWSRMRAGGMWRGRGPVDEVVVRVGRRRHWRQVIRLGLACGGGPR
nr:unnamed protein product [Digitaria exilis]